MNRKMYQKPEMEIHLLTASDVIVTSGEPYTVMEYGPETQMHKMAGYQSGAQNSDWVEMNNLPEDTQ